MRYTCNDNEWHKKKFYASVPLRWQIIQVQLQDLNVGQQLLVCLGPPD
jgi:hypothetical protein